MGGRADEDENGNPPAEVPRALARYREARLRRAAESRRLRVVSESTEPRDSSDGEADERDESERGTGWTSSAFANMRIGGRLDEDASDGSSSEEDDDAYAVFGRATMKAQSDALREVGGVRGGIRGPWRGRMNIRTKESSAGRTDRRTPLANLGGNVPPVTIPE